MKFPNRMNDMGFVLQLLSGVQNLQVFRPDNLECSQFYISLYDLMKRLDFRTGSDLGISCLTVLQRATRNLDARQDLLNQFRFVPLLAKLLDDATNKVSSRERKTS